MLKKKNEREKSNSNEEKGRPAVGVMANTSTAASSVCTNQQRDAMFYLLWP